MDDTLRLQLPSISERTVGTLNKIAILKIGDKEHPILKGVNKIGRHPDNFVIIEDITVSKFHAEIQVDAKNVFIRDLNSFNKTYMNDTILVPDRYYQLVDGSKLTFGSITGTFVYQYIPNTAPVVKLRNEPNSTLNLSSDESDESVVFVTQQAPQGNPVFIEPSVPINNDREIYNVEAQVASDVGSTSVFTVESQFISSRRKLTFGEETQVSDKTSTHDISLASRTKVEENCSDSASPILVNAAQILESFNKDGDNQVYSTSNPIVSPLRSENNSVTTVTSPHHAMMVNEKVPSKSGEVSATPGEMSEMKKISKTKEDVSKSGKVDGGPSKLAEISSISGPKEITYEPGVSGLKYGVAVQSQELVASMKSSKSTKTTKMDQDEGKMTGISTDDENDILKGLPEVHIAGGNFISGCPLSSNLSSSLPDDCSVSQLAKRMNAGLEKFDAMEEAEKNYNPLDDPKIKATRVTVRNHEKKYNDDDDDYIEKALAAMQNEDSDSSDDEEIAMTQLKEMAAKSKDENYKSTVEFETRSRQAENQNKEVTKNNVSKKSAEVEEKKRRGRPPAAKNAPGSSSCRQKGKKYVIIFTGINVKKNNILEAVESLGGTVTNDPIHATILVTNRVHKRYKFLCAISKCLKIVSIKWLEDSQKSNQFLDPDEYILNDTESEIEYGFNLRESLEAASKHSLLKNYTFLITPKVFPGDAKNFKGMIQVAGGKVIVRVPKTWTENTVIISCNEDIPKVKEITAKIPKDVNVPIVTSEFILSGILKQKLDFESHQLYM